MPHLSVIEGKKSEKSDDRSPLDKKQLDLIKQAAEGDRIAIDALLRQVGPSMIRVVRVVLGVSAPDCEDVFQESLLALVGALPSFRAEASLNHFASRIAARTAVRARRKAKDQREKHLALASSQAPLQGSSATPGTQLEAERRKAFLRRMLEELPEVQAETLVLRVVLGYSLGDVAQATGVPLNTVRSRIRLAKEALRRRIERDPAGSELRRDT